MSRFYLFRPVKQMMWHPDQGTGFEECCRRWMCTVRERGAVQEPGVDEVDCVDEAAVLEHWPPGFRCAVIRVMGLA